MKDSLYRIITIGRNTLTEAIRQKVLNVLLLFGLLAVGSSAFVSNLLVEEQVKFVKDFCCGSIGLIGFAIALLSTAQLIPQELQNRTIYTILAKPVYRAEFLLGKFLGVTLLLTLCVLLMSLVFAGALWLQEMRALSDTRANYEQLAAQGTMKKYLDKQEEQDIADIRTQVEDPRLVEAVVLLYAKLLLTTGIALFFSTFATSFIFTVVTTGMVYLAGHLESVAREVWFSRGAETSIWQDAFSGLVTMLIPDFNSFTIIDEILAGNPVPWAHTFNLLGYAGAYLVIVLALSELSFRYREL